MNVCFFVENNYFFTQHPQELIIHKEGSKASKNIKVIRSLIWFRIPQLLVGTCFLLKSSTQGYSPEVVYGSHFGYVISTGHKNGSVVSKSNPDQSADFPSGNINVWNRSTTPRKSNSSPLRMPRIPKRKRQTSSFPIIWKRGELLNFGILWHFFVEVALPTSQIKNMHEKTVPSSIPWSVTLPEKLLHFSLQFFILIDLQIPVPVWESQSAFLVILSSAAASGPKTFFQTSWRRYPIFIKDIWVFPKIVGVPPNHPF